MLQDGLTIYEREQSFGGNQLTQDIVRAYGLSFDEAEMRKKSGDLPEKYQADILAPFLESAALEVARAIQFFFTSTAYNRVDHLFLAGGCALIAGLQETVVARTKIACSVLSPFEGMQLAPSVRDPHHEAPAYLVACGLALRRFS
jgi:type IV pilus assembly protein PilM